MIESLKGVSNQRKTLCFCLTCALVLVAFEWQTTIYDIIPRNVVATLVSRNLTNTNVQSRANETNDSILCDRIISADANEIKKAKQILEKKFRRSYLPEIYPDLTKDCKWYRSTRKYISKAMDTAEAQFPLAFSLLVFKHAEQVERLLRAIWRPQNVYCIHIDQKSHPNFKTAITSITKCFDNVFIHAKSVDVKWGTYTVLEPELLCMDALWNHKTKWKYFINLTGQEFPLKTNYELYRILQAYNGMNDIGGGYKGANLDRWAGRGSPPHAIQPRKGSVHIAASRAFVDYLLHNQTSRDLLEWIKKTGVPDETYFATLNFNAHLRVPGSYTGAVDDGKYEQEWTRYKIWYDPAKCSGKFVHAICIFSVGDLLHLTNSKFMFANKFHYDYHYLSYDCLEYWYHKKVKREMEGHLNFNTTVYKNRWRASHHF